MMTLKKLEIERGLHSFQAHYNKHIGTAVFDGEIGEVKINLTPELAHRIFLLCAEGIVTVAKEAASALVLEAQATVAKDASPAIGGRR